MMCCIPNCCHYTERNTCQYFRFPRDKKELEKWIKLVQRHPRPSSRICSCHFKDGKKKNGPSIFPWNTKEGNKTTSEKKTRKTTNNITCIPDIIFDFSESTLDGSDSISECAYNEEKCVQTEPIILCDRSTQKDTPVSVLAEAENTLLRAKVERQTLELEKLRKQRFGFSGIKDDDKVVKYYTGMSQEMFSLVVNLCRQASFEYFYDWKVESLDLCDQILITLMKLRLNLDYVDLAVRFSTSVHTIGNVVLTFIHLLHEILYQQLTKDVPSQEENVFRLPNWFSSHRSCPLVMDCVEFSYSLPKRTNIQKKTNSKREQRQTLKGLIGVAPNDVIAYCSLLYPGCTSNKEIVTHCGVLDILKPSDLILADVAFVREDVLTAGVSIKIPPFLLNPQFVSREIKESDHIAGAEARTRMERAVRQLNYFKILNFNSKILYKYSSKVFQLCAALCNLQNTLKKNVEKVRVTRDSENSTSEDDD